MEEERQTCLVVEGGLTHYNFQLRCLSIGDKAEKRPIGNEECMSGMKKPINCLRGGAQSYENWKYK